MESTIMQPSLVGEYQRTIIGCAVILYFHLRLTGNQMVLGIQIEAGSWIFPWVYSHSLGRWLSKSWSYCFPYCCYYYMYIHYENTIVVLTMFGYLVAVQSCMGCSWCIVLQCIVLSLLLFLQLWVCITMTYVVPIVTSTIDGTVASTL